MSAKIYKSCQYCGSACIKAGKYNNGVQKLKCKTCHKYQLESYKNIGCQKKVKENILRIYLKNVAIRDVAALLKISVNTVIKEIKQYSTYRKKIAYPSKAEYEIDEIRTYVGNKENIRWLAYAIERETRTVVSLSLGGRTKATLKKVVNAVLKLNPSKIYTDGLRQYRFLIPSVLHKVQKHRIQRIERNNLTTRGKLRRLNRKTIAYSKTESMLLASVKLLFWKQEYQGALL